MHEHLDARVSRVYHDRRYRHATVVNHRGTLVSLAMDDRRRIHYTVLDLATAQREGHELDNEAWSADPRELPFPDEIVQVGFASLDPVAMPTVHGDSHAEVERGSIDDAAVDPFLSTTARLGDDVPFQALSDGHHVYVLRQAVAPDHDDAVFRLAAGGAARHEARQYVQHHGERVPVVDRTLLVDRYLLNGDQLVVPRDVRFRRSRNAVRPASVTDSLGSTDLEGRPFLEPTRELDLVGPLADGRFTALLLPTIVADVQRWQIFHVDGDTAALVSLNLGRDRRGWFDRSNDGDVSVRVHLEGHEIAGGISSALYHEQEAVHGAAKPQHLSQHARVLVAVVARPDDAVRGDVGGNVVVLDHSITKHGTLFGLSSEDGGGGVTVPVQTIGADLPDVTAGLQRAGRIDGLEAIVGEHAEEVATREQDLGMGPDEPVADRLENARRRLAELDRGRERLRGIDEEIRRATTRKASLDRKRSVTFYEDPNKGGKSFTLSEGEQISDLGKKVKDKHGFVVDILKSDVHWDDEISSIEVEDGAWVELRTDEGLQGSEWRLASNYDDLRSASGWNDNIESLRVKPTDALTSERAGAGRELQELSDEKKALEEAAAGRSAVEEERERLERLQRARRERDAARDELGRLLSEAPALAQTVEMPSPHDFATGVSATAALLAFAQASAPPLLMTSAHGRVGLYLVDRGAQMLAAHYDVRTQPGRLRIPGGDDAWVVATAVPGVAAPGSLDLRIAPTSDADTCRVQLSFDQTSNRVNREFAALGVHTPASITVDDVPRAPQAFAAKVNEALASASPAPPPVVLDPGAATANVQDGPALLSRQRRPRWTPDHPGHALALRRGQVVQTPSVTKGDVAREDDLTIEAWVRATVATTGDVVAFAASDDRYGLGLAPVDRATAMVFDGDHDVTSPVDAEWLRGGFTVEAWVRLDAVPAGDQPILGNEHGGQGRGLHFTIRGGRPYLGFYSDDLAATSTSEELEPHRWHHVAATWNAEDRERILYLDGREVGRDTSRGRFVGSGPLHIGRIHDERRLRGALDHVRVWSVPRSAEEVQMYARREVSGGAGGLLASWSFAGAHARDRSGNGHHAVVPTAATVVKGPLGAVRWVAEVGDRRITSKTATTVGSWAHVAAIYDESHALRFTGDAHADVPASPTLDIVDDLTIEAVLRLDTLGRPHGVVSKGDPSGTDAEHLPYSLHVDAQGHLVFAYGAGGDEPVVRRSASALVAGRVHSIAVIRTAGQEQKQTRGTRTLDVQVPSGDDPDTTVTRHESFDVVESVSLEHYDVVRFVVDGKLEEELRNDDRTTPRGNDAKVVLGRATTSDGVTSNLAGDLCELRLWNTARAHDSVGRPPGRDEQGLVAWWRMEEPGSHVADDHVGSSHAVLRGTSWIQNPDPDGPSFDLLVDGAKVAVERTVAAADGATRAGLGGPAATTPHDGFTGELDEVRIWKTARTEEQVLDQMFGRLRGGRRDLIACWSFDRVTPNTDEGTDERVVRDSGPRGNDLAISQDVDPGTCFVPSTAPIAIDAPEVRSAMGGPPTTFHAFVDGRVGVAEYADLERAPDGTLSGVQKRCYVSTRDGRWHLTTGYEVGSLVTEWVGQAQFDPQVVGYIEGAPPVPGENLTETNLGFETATGHSEVTLREVDDVTMTTSSSKEESYRTGFEAAASMGSKGKLSVVAAPMGVGVSEEMEYEVSSDLRLGMETGGSWGGSESSSVSRSTTRSSTAGLGGRWDTSDREKWANEALTLRWVPSNVGFAFVESLVADVYALRLRHTGTVVALRMVPNRDIPRDTNIIPFMIDPTYTMQGTLDGRLGMVHAPQVDGQRFANVGPGVSYFRPKEAYALKRQIEREEQEARAFFAAFETTPSGARMLRTLQPSIATLASAGAAGAAIGGSFAVPVLAGATLAAGVGTTIASAIQYAAKDDDLVQKFAARDLCNTYVWTAKGGFFEEAADVTRVRSTSTTGSYELSGSASGGFAGGVSGPLAFSLGLTGTMSGGIHETRSADRETSETFGLDVVLDVPGDVQEYDYDDGAGPGDGASGQYDEDGRPREAVGKVDAYRFMTFYLDPRRSHLEELFTRVIDPRWLEAGSAEARALQQARQAERTPPCWRVLHRVTYVHRVLPDVGDTPDQPTWVRPDISRDFELLRRLEAPVRRELGVPTGPLPDGVEPAIFERAVRNAVEDVVPEMGGDADVEAITDVLAVVLDVDRDAVATT